MLHDLNDDCLHHIFGMLSLTDQMSIRRIGRRFEEIIKSLWRQQCKTVSISREQLDTVNADGHNKELITFLAYISGSVEHLKLERIDSEQLLLLEPLRFPKVISLECVIWNKTGVINCDEYTLLLHKLFPTVRKLSYQASISGKHLWQFSNVQDLDLDGNECLDTKHFEKIFSSLKLRKLSLMFYGYNVNLDKKLAAITRCGTMEEMRLDDHHLYYLMDTLCDMRRLRKITCYTRDYDDFLLGQLANLYGDRMQAITFSDVFWSKEEHVETVLKMQNLRKLVFIDDDVDDEQLEQIALTLTGLREFRYIKSEAPSADSEPLDGDAVLSIVENCPQLELLDVTFYNLKEDFLQRVINVVEKQHKRKVALQLLCHGTLMAKNYDKEMFLPKQLCINMNKPTDAWPTARIFECAWLPVEVDDVEDNSGKRAEQVAQ